MSGNSTLVPKSSTNSNVREQVGYKVMMPKAMNSDTQALTKKKFGLLSKEGIFNELKDPYTNIFIGKKHPRIIKSQNKSREGRDQNKELPPLILNNSNEKIDDNLRDDISTPGSKM